MLLFLFVPLFCIGLKLDNDTYWIIKTGEEICKNGIPTKDFLTIHTNMDLVVQQWLSDIIYYKLYDIFGITGPVFFTWLIYFIYSALIYKFSIIISDRRLVVPLVLLVVNILVMRLFWVTRPQIFSYCIILAELIALESYVKTKKIKNLFILPVLSVLEVNLHASMWTMLFIVMLPYFANALPIKIKGKSISCCNFAVLTAAAAVTAVCGLINPYGYKGLAFIFTTSVGTKVDDWITELAALKLNTDLTDLAFIFVIALLVFIYIFNRKGKTTLRYALLSIGTCLMMCLHIKLAPYFLITAVPAAFKYTENIKFNGKTANKNPKNEYDKKTKLIRTAITAFCIVFSVGGVIGLVYDEITETTAYLQTDGKTEYTKAIDTAVDIMEKDAEKNNLQPAFFNSFNSGGYLEFKGYKAYIDPRADSFVIEANHDFDYLTEYKNISKGQIYFEDVFKKYGFNYAIYEPDISPALYTEMTHNSHCTLLYEDDEIALFRIELEN